jgi:uncharacterized delta-60 repeat protein
MGFIRDNTNSFEVYLTDLGKQKFFEDGFKDSISYFSISDTDSNYTIFNPALNEIISFQKMSEINVGDVVSFNSYAPINNNSIYNIIDVTTDNFEINSGFANTGSVYSIALQPDGKILTGGLFSTYSGITRNNIIRLNNNGTIDNTFNIGTGFNSEVNTIALQPDGKILAGGFFTSYSGVTRNRIIRLNTGGTIDNTFNIGTGFTGGNVKTITVQSDNKILVGGQFTSYSGVTSNCIVRLNTGGTIDNTFNIGDGFNSDVFSIELQPDGKILVSGSFTSYNNITCNGIIRLNSDATIDATFNSGNGFMGGPNTLKLQPDGKILAGGGGSYNNIDMIGLIRLNIDGSVDKIENIVTRYFRNIKEFSNKNQLPFFNVSLTTNNEYWEEIFPFDSVNINPQTLQILNHSGVKKTSLPLNITKENDYNINKTITITSLSDYNSMLNGTMLVGDSIGNNGKYSEVIHLIYNEFNPSVIIPPLVTFPPVFNEKIRKSAIIASENTKIYSDYKSGIIGNGSKIANNIYINITEEQIILEEGVFNGIVIKPYYENTWKHDPQTLTPAINHVSYEVLLASPQLVFNFDAYYSQEYYVFTVLDDYNTPPVGNGQIKITTPSGETTTFSIINTNDPTGQTRNFFIASPYPPPLNSISGDTLTVSFDYFIPDLINIQILAVNNFIIESKLQINVINDIFTQTTLRGDIVDGLNYRNALFGIKNKIQKDYVMFEPDYNSDDTLSILTYTVNE